MQQRSLLALLAATVLLVAAAGYALVSENRAVRPAVHEARVFPDLAAHLGDLAWMRITRGAMRADLNLVAGHWAVIEKGNYPAAAGTVRRLLLGLAELTLVEPKTARPELFGRLDLDDPSNGKSTLVALQDRTGKTVGELIVGKVRHDRLGGGSDAVYVRKPGAARAWLARGSLDLPATLAGWLDRHIIDIPPARIAAVVLTAPDGSTLTLRRGSAADKFAIADIPEGSKPKADGVLARPAAALAALDLDDVKPTAELPPPQRDVATAGFTTFDGLVVTLRLFARDNIDWIAIAAASNGGADNDAQALNARVARWVYAIPAERAGLLRTTLADLVEPEGGS